ncbi:Matrix metalloproteinase-14 [Holothuria leucospilota]|uniref:Matrix metalloproteinase-14 n=1 Tax=Holothuria leucospilota TaxID=206669 RepID=A0A9Q1BEN0_HOLLE|nr:Matrix metalloproteinase-14 [Holothuria leucospilota]
MSRPRCDFPDVFTAENESRKKRFTPTGQPWLKRNLSWFLENDSRDVKLNRTDVESEIGRALQRWADAAGILTFFKAPDVNSADILLSFQVGNHSSDYRPFDGPGGSIAHAFPPGTGLGGDVHFDDDDQFLIHGRYNLHQVATHELGHSLGLGHLSDSTAVMAPFYRDVDPTDFQLQPSDISYIRILYGRDDFRVSQSAHPRPPASRTYPTTLAPTPTTTTRTIQAMHCNAQFDAATETLDGGVYFFQGEQVFKVRLSVGIVDGYPKRLSEEFSGLNIGFIDAALTYHVNSTFVAICIFKSDNYWLFDQSGIIQPGYPKNITANWGGVPANLDAAFTWRGNGFVYFIKGSHYYRYNPRIGRVEAGYPRPLRNWRGVETPVDGVFRYKGQTFFLREQYYQNFDDRKFIASDKVPSAPKWLRCGTELQEDNNTIATDVTGETAGCGIIRSQYALTWIIYGLYLLMQY